MHGLLTKAYFGYDPGDWRRLRDAVSAAVLDRYVTAASAAPSGLVVRASHPRDRHVDWRSDRYRGAAIDSAIFAGHFGNRLAPRRRLRT